MRRSSRGGNHRRAGTDAGRNPKAQQAGKIPVLVDPHAAIRTAYQPDVLIDAILAKKNLGTEVTDAPFVIGVGRDLRQEKTVTVS